MMLRAAVAGFLGVMTLANVAMAEPVVCPDANLIKAAGFSDIEEAWEHYYGAYRMDEYNTNHQWFFVLVGIKAKSKEIALEKANKMLPRLSGHPSPEQDGATWTCKYNGYNKNYLAAASTVIPGSISPASMIRRIATSSY